MLLSRFYSSLAVTILTVVPAMANGHNTAHAIQEGNTTSLSAPDSYFRDPTALNILNGHIAFMSFGWFGAFPLCKQAPATFIFTGTVLILTDIMLDLADSNLAYPAQIWFLGLHAIGIVLGLAYNSKTPDLYPGSSHPKLGWVLTAIATLQVSFGLLRAIVRSRATTIVFTKGDDNEGSPFISFSGRGPRSQEDLEASSSASSPCGGEDRRDSSGTDSDTLCDASLSHHRTTLDRRYNEPTSWINRWMNVVDSNRLVPILTTASTITHVVLVFLSFATLCTGIVTVTGIFVSSYTHAHCFSKILTSPSAEKPSSTA